MTVRNDWRLPILQHFSAESAKAGRITVVADPDALLTEPGVVQQLTERGFDLVTFDDPVAFRWAYESRFRQQWDRGDAAHIVLVIRTPQGDADHVPYDVLEEAREAGRVLSFALGQVFPTLSPGVVADLDRHHFDALAAAVQRVRPGAMGTNATRDFVLRHVFEVAPELIKQPSDLLRVLLRRHYGQQAVPERLDGRLIEVLGQDPQWREWPLERIVRDRATFLTFLGERWPSFLVRRGLSVVPGRELLPLIVHGPVDLPFEHDDVRVYMDNLFAEGILAPTATVSANEGAGWVSVGIVGAAASSPIARYEHILDELRGAVPGQDASHQTWQEFAPRWGTYVRLRWQTHPDRDGASESHAQALAAHVHGAFSSWLLRRFGPMATLPYLPRPVLGHHVPHYLAHLLSQQTVTRVALLVLDGMAFDDWRILGESLDAFSVEEHAIFSWVPTLTQIGRQAIFSGRIPLEFAASIEGTHREPQHWSNFWQDHGLSAAAVRYVQPQGKKESFDALADAVLAAADEAAVTVMGAVVGLIDQHMHQMGLGTPGLHGLVEVWARSRAFARLVDALHQRGFAVFVTADHGNVFGRGFGKPDVGVTAQQRGERAHIFRSKVFRDATAPQYPGAIEWPQVGLPPDYYALLAPHGACFIPEGKEAVSHGGIALEEVMVPFARIAEKR